MGIGGEYAAINSAIDELIPAKYRGRVDIARERDVLGWRAARDRLDPARRQPPAGELLVAGRLPVRARSSGSSSSSCARTSPRAPAGCSCTAGTKRPRRRWPRSNRPPSSSGGTLGEVDESKAIEITPATNIGFIALARTLFARYPKRSILGASLMITQSFLYNAIFFTYALVLTKIYGVSDKDTAYYFIFFALGNLIGPLTIGRLFDTIGRRVMISGTYILSGALLAISAFLFDAGVLNAVTQTICWCVIFFFASAGASAAYLTVSEIFPVEVRAKAIAVFFAIAQTFGAMGPGSTDADRNGQDHAKLFIGYLIGAGVMVAGGWSRSSGGGRRGQVARGHRQPAVLGGPVVPIVERDRRTPTTGGAGDRLLTRRPTLC